MGTATDPYQRAEGRYRLMPRIVEALTAAHNPFSILTKGTLILRDLGILQEAATVTSVSAAFSIGTMDEETWRRTEPGTPHPRERMAAVAKLNAAGIPCGVLMAPILPGITDRPRMLREVVHAAIDAGATHVSPIMLHLRPGVREGFMEWLVGTHPNLVERYRDMYPRSYAPPSARRELRGRVDSLVRSLGGTPPRANPSRWSRREGHGSAPAPATQLTLM